MNDSIPALEHFIEPSPVPFTLEAPGWQVAGVCLVLLFIAGIMLTLRHYYKNRYRRVALKQLQQQTTNFISKNQYTDLIYNANMLMKQICIKLYTREVCADLRAKDWLDFLNETSRPNLFQQENERVLSSLYSDENQLGEKETTAFANKTKQWIKHHKHAISPRK